MDEKGDRIDDKDVEVEEKRKKQEEEDRDIFTQNVILNYNYSLTSSSS